MGEVADREMRWNEIGRMAAARWRAIPDHFRQIRLDSFVVMPNHIHGIILLPDGIGDPDNGVTGSVDDIPVESQVIVAQRRATTSVAPTKPSLGAVVGAFNSWTTVQYIPGVKTLGWPPFFGKLWQRNYYEHTSSAMTRPWSVFVNTLPKIRYGGLMTSKTPPVRRPCNVVVTMQRPPILWATNRDDPIPR